MLVAIECAWNVHRVKERGRLSRLPGVRIYDVGQSTNGKRLPLNLWLFDAEGVETIRLPGSATAADLNRYRRAFPEADNIMAFDDGQISIGPANF
jgi:hypothetical protein